MNAILRLQAREHYVLARMATRSGSVPSPQRLVGRREDQLLRRMQRISSTAAAPRSISFVLSVRGDLYSIPSEGVHSSGVNSRRMMA